MEKFKFLKKSNLSRLPTTVGVYAFKKGAKFFYVGKAANIKERVKQHKDLLGLAKEIGYIKTNSEIEALILEAKLIKKIQPKYNVLWRDDKNYFYVAITKESFPRVFITHQLKIKNCKLKIDFIGPFIEGTSLKRALTYLRRTFPYYTSKSHPKGSCLWCHLKLCPGPDPVKPEYQKNIKSLIFVLKGNSRKVLNDLKRRMKKSSLLREYEKAAKIRDKITSLERVISHARVFEPQIEPAGVDPQQIPGRAEAYDVSNIQGEEAAGSMVTFINGRPAKSFYRKFKIKIAGKPNDIAMIKEILSRRLRHTEWPYPDLILIDGGKAQLNAALRAINLATINLAKPSYRLGLAKFGNIRIMAIAKKKNELFIEGRKKPVLLKTLPREMFNLILQLRDEAHRFAISYHRKLRRKRLLPN